MSGPLQAPFPWFGGKARIAPAVWQALGPEVAHYVEPFCGSAAVLLARPDAPGLETINDADGFVCNLWRSLQAAPAAVAQWADWPVCEADLHPRHVWLLERRATLTAQLLADPAYYDAQAAGWWVWGVSSWIGSGWCAGTGPWTIAGGQLVRHDAGKGVHRQLPHLGDAGQGVHRPGQSLAAWFAALAARLRRVRICCGDWRRVLTPAVLGAPRRGITGVFLDPPYALTAGRTPDLYAVDEDVSAAVSAWCRAHTATPSLRIALAGYEGEHALPGWRPVAWKATGGYGSQGNRQGRPNAARERLWLSPSCAPAPATQLRLL